jgi:hypothetical protein
MKSRHLSRKTKTLLYKTLIRPVLKYGAETWALSKSDEAGLGVLNGRFSVKSMAQYWMEEGGAEELITNCTNCIMIMIW